MNALTNIALALASAPFPLMLLAKVTLVFLLGAIVAFALRNSAAAYRHAVWALTLTAVIALPLGISVGPVWRVAVASTAPASSRLSNSQIEPSSITTTVSTNVVTGTETIASRNPVSIDALASVIRNSGIDHHA
jgi:hypothetical protein